MLILTKFNLVFLGNRSIKLESLQAIYNIASVVYIRINIFGVDVKLYINTSGNWKKREIGWKHNAL